jgi:hypothetical protein
MTTADHDPSKFYTQAQLTRLPDGDYEVVAEGVRINVRGTTVTRVPTYQVRRLDD